MANFTQDPESVASYTQDTRKVDGIPASFGVARFGVSHFGLTDTQQWTQDQEEQTS